MDNAARCPHTHTAAAIKEIRSTGRLTKAGSAPTIPSPAAPAQGATSCRNPGARSSRYAGATSSESAVALSGQASKPCAARRRRGAMQELTAFPLGHRTFSEVGVRSENERRNQPIRLAHLDHADDCAILLESGKAPARVKTRMLRHRGDCAGGCPIRRSGAVPAPRARLGCLVRRGREHHCPIKSWLTQFAAPTERLGPASQLSTHISLAAMRAALGRI